MIIATFTIEHPVMGVSLRDIPGIRIEWEETYTNPNGRNQMLFWVTCPDFSAVEAAVAEDDAVSNLTVFETVGDRRLCRVEFTDIGDRTNLMGELIEVGAVLQAAVGTNSGWRCQVRFASRDGYQRIYAFCREHDIPFHFEKLYEQTETNGNGQDTLTDGQRELLLEAVASGYLEIPRGSSLEELAGRLGISETAASERFRRGVRNLVRESVDARSDAAESRS
ncbi:helix-turn-helix domain-containing protein [Halorarius litoreus]|uniref:helix-turn-helix domain-containing protein n=1 Tax=Halorarius litoreus TaxID=2962676 RepID=UPI0020CF5731|nr:helix-turn-helix domain-containing protein [Halorarius litoreus]